MNIHSNTSKFALGAAQFGLAYGISNVIGKLTKSEGKEILFKAQSAGVHTIDTAIAYGDSESTLGELGVAEWRVITKLPELDVSEGSVEHRVQMVLNDSLKRLQIESVHGLLLHRPAQLLGPDGKSVYRALMAERERGRATKIGISIYDPEELEGIPSSMNFDIVQAPLNIFDMRMVRSGWIEKLQEVGCELHVRSIFLQGLLLMQRSTRPSYFSRWNHLWESWENWLEEAGLSPLQACVRHALRTPGVETIVVGVNSAAQLVEILAAAEGEMPTPPANLRTDDITFLNPSLWNLA
jgi:aryl-alcohol dehydrogenase-like predicted oxidoreductase